MTSFRNDLARWGPPARSASADRQRAGNGPILSLPEAERYCRKLARTHYENFTIASWLLPRRRHQHLFNIYAFCRWADDLGDEIGDPQESLRLLNWWRAELSACYEGRTSHPVFIALSKTIDEFRLPRALFGDLISAFEQDQVVREYQTFEELLGYCRCSANPVGRLVLHVCGAATEESFRWSDAICTGLQLANFWQDVRRDYEAGRVYVPKEDRDRFGYRDEDLRKMVVNGAFRELMRFEVDRAREFLQSGLALVPLLRGRLQVDIELFARGGLKILDRIEAIDYRVWERRPVVTPKDQAVLFASCVARALLRAGTGAAGLRGQALQNSILSGQAPFARRLCHPTKLNFEVPDPGRACAAPSLAESYAYCESLSRRTAKNFYLSFLGLPPKLFRSMCAIYAFMRVCDDLCDSPEVSASAKAANLARWSQSLDRALTKLEFDHPVFPALAEVVQTHGIPKQYLFDVIEGMRIDLDSPCFDTFSDLAHYCYHVAGAVGLCCIHIWGFHGEQALEDAKACGLAFQLTNILRDLSEDAQMGRVYLPREDLKRFDYSEHDILNRVYDARFVALMKFQVERAKQYYLQAERLFQSLDPVGKPVLRAMLRVYGSLLTEIERRRYDVFTRRVAVPRWRKLLIATTAMVQRRWLEASSRGLWFRRRWAV